MLHSGFIIILRADLDHKKYEASEFACENLENIKKLRKTLSFINTANYRGTGREQFTGEPFFYENGKLKTLTDGSLDNYNNIEARKLYAAYQEANIHKDEIKGLCFFKLKEMLDVYELIKNKTDFEVLEIIESEEQTTNKTLGFDVGYIGGDFFSAIADVAIKPRWHPPNLDDMKDIIVHLKKLNQHCLFPSLQKAKDYRTLYLTKSWAEEEAYDGKITTIQIRKK